MLDKARITTIFKIFFSFTSAFHHIMYTKLNDVIMHFYGGDYVVVKLIF